MSDEILSNDRRVLTSVVHSSGHMLVLGEIDRHGLRTALNSMKLSPQGASTGPIEKSLITLSQKFLAC